MPNLSFETLENGTNHVRFNSCQATQAMSEPHGTGQLTDTPDVRPDAALGSHRIAHHPTVTRHLTVAGVSASWQSRQGELGDSTPVM